MDTEEFNKVFEEMRGFIKLQVKVGFDSCEAILEVVRDLYKDKFIPALLITEADQIITEEIEQQLIFHEK